MVILIDCYWICFLVGLIVWSEYLRISAVFVSITFFGGGARALLSSHSWVGGIGMVKSWSRVTWAILGNRDLKPEPTYWTRFPLWILSSAFASVLCKMLCEELSVQLGCTAWPEPLQIPLGRIPGGCSWGRDGHGGGLVRTTGNLPQSKF